MTTPNFTSLLTALRAFVLKSRPAYKDYLGTESVEEKTVLLTGTLSATGESITAADGFTGFTNGQTYKAIIGEETVEVTAQYGTGSFSECIVIGSSNVAPSDTVPGWMVCVYNGNLLGFGTGDWAGKQIEVATSKMVPTAKWDIKTLPEECLPAKMPEKYLTNSVPLIASVATSGIAEQAARADHVHPKEVSDEDRASWNAKLDEADLEALTEEEIDEMWDPPVALKFSSPEPFTLSVANTTKNWDGTLEYSTDAKTWTTWNGTTTLSSGNNKLYVRGTGNSKITGGYGKGWTLSGTTISCSGNIETLLDWQTAAKGKHPTMADNCYYFMFYNCTSLTTVPELPATTLVDNCYNSMFHNCTSLTTVPELPATTLANYCYSNMFSDCTSLTTVPELPATTLADNCYDSMFYDCTSLTTSPELPATTLADNCYNYMFYNCTSLTTVPELPATTLANYCYSNMFSDCTSLTTVPELPATTLADNCYDSMFHNCTSLTTVPELPATTLIEGCYSNMFSDCTSLTTVPELPATTLVGNCYNFMFRGCISLTAVPELPATTLANYCYNSMFYNCRKIKLSTTPNNEYLQEYRIPTSGTGTTASGALSNMFASTGGTFTGSPTINTTYYLHKDNSIVPAT